MSFWASGSRFLWSPVRSGCWYRMLWCQSFGCLLMNKCGFVWSGLRPSLSFKAAMMRAEVSNALTNSARFNETHFCEARRPHSSPLGPRTCASGLFRSLGHASTAHCAGNSLRLAAFRFPPLPRTLSEASHVEPSNPEARWPFPLWPAPLIYHTEYLCVICRFRSLLRNWNGQRYFHMVSALAKKLASTTYSVPKYNRSPSLRSYKVHFTLPINNISV